MDNGSTLPDLSIVIVTLKGLRQLAVPLPGILSQTIAPRIELIVVAPPGEVTPEDTVGVPGLHSVQLVEREGVGDRGRDAVAGVAVARAPFVALHENHTRAEPETFERLLTAFRPSDAAVCPVLYPANGEMPWGNAMYALAHAEAAPPNDPMDRRALVLHSAVYRTALLQPYGDRLRVEHEVHADLLAAGHTLRFVPGTVVWHVNEARPRRVVADSIALGRAFGFGRSRSMGLAERSGRALLLPAIAAKNALRCLDNARRSAASRQDFLRAAGPTALTAASFAAGEVRGYFDRRSAWSEANELHEFHVRGRLNGREPAARWLAEAIRSIPEGAP